MSRTTIARANLVGLLAWASLMLIVLALTAERVVAVHAGNGWVVHTEEVLGTIQKLEIRLRDRELGARPAGADPGALQRRLQLLTRDNPSQQDRLRRLAPLLQQDLSDTQAAEINTLLEASVAEEQRLLALRLAANGRREAWLACLGAVAVMLILLALAWAARLLNLAWRRATHMEDQQRLLAERLSTSLESLSQGVAVFDSSRRLTDWNRCFTVLLRLGGSDLRAGLSYRTLLQSVARDPGEAAVLESEEDLRRTGEPRPDQPLTFERIRADGQHLELRRTAMRDGGFVLTISDMTRRMQTEAVLRQAQKMQAMGQLTGGIAHDFNNLLTVILGNLEVTQKRLPAEHALQDHLGRAIWAAQRGAALTSQLLAFARRQPLMPQPIDLADTVPALVPLLRRTLGASIDVRFTGMPGLWPAMADQVQLESALLNLALNARDAMPRGGRLSIEIANQVIEGEDASGGTGIAPGDYAVLSVADTGHGMTHEVATRAFEPFYTTKKAGSGTGLGLAMVFGFVKQSKGHVTLCSEPGRGTLVKLYLPRAPDDAVAAASGLRDETTILPSGINPVAVPNGAGSMG